LIQRFPFWLEALDNQIYFLSQGFDLDAPDEGLFVIRLFVLGVIFLDGLDSVLNEVFVNGRKTVSLDANLAGCKREQRGGFEMLHS
jgi:hypothetical protein